MPERGPEANIRTSLAILFNETASCFKAPCVSTMASFAANASNLLAAVINGCPVNSAIYSATFTSYPSGVFNPVPTAVPPKATSDKCVNVFLIAFKP